MDNQNIHHQNYSSSKIKTTLDSIVKGEDTDNENTGFVRSRWHLTISRSKIQIRILGKV